jgi:hypothetical protein
MGACRFDREYKLVPRRYAGGRQRAPAAKAGDILGRKMDAPTVDLDEDTAAFHHQSGHGRQHYRRWMWRLHRWLSSR